MAPRKAAKRAGGDDKESGDKKVQKTDENNEVTENVADENEAPKAKPKGRGKKEPTEVVKRELRQRPERVEPVPVEKPKGRGKGKDKSEAKASKKAAPKKSAAKKKKETKDVEEEDEESSEEVSEKTNGDAKVAVEHCTS